MQQYYILALLPAALGCLNADTNSTVTATTGLPAWATNCSNKPSQISAECTCNYSGAGGSSPTTTLKTTTTAGSGGAITTPAGVTTTLPASKGATSTSKAITVSAGQTYDGGMKKFDRSPRVCQEQTETGEADAMFVLEAGATLANVIIGPDQAEGVHCKGTCTLSNVWWSDVCEDALTLKQSSGTSYVIGGGAFKASDKIVQFNGFGTVSISKFYANDYGKVVRSCGNCPRHIIIDNTIAVNGGVLCGINTNYGDTCVVTNSCQDDNKICDRYTGNNSGAEPPKIGSGPDGTYCKASGTTTAC
uniref:Pectate lyase n=1 Tax=Colletotrichum fructicola (strain Nara gc5) TaxID=1213859 RepID=L2FK51_COLFN